MSSEMLIDGTSMDIDEQDVFRKDVASVTSAGQKLAEVSAGQRTHYLYEWKSHCKEHRGDPIELDDFIRREVAKLGSTDTKRRGKAFLLLYRTTANSSSFTSGPSESGQNTLSRRA